MPTWNMIGKPITTADNVASIPVVSQRFRVPTTKFHSLLQGVGLGIIFHDATYAALGVELWADRDELPSVLIASSTTSWTKAQVDANYAEDYKCLFMGFEFTPYPLRKGTWYHLVLRPTTYTGDATNHIAWRHSYPDAQYRDALGFTIEAIKAAKVPLEAMIFAAEM